MERRQTRMRVAVTVLVLAGLLVFCLYALAGDLEPNAPPAPTMHTLDEIYNAVTSVSPSISQRESYCKYSFCANNRTTTILTVPAGRRFVLRKVSVMPPQGTSWSIIGGANLHVESFIAYRKYNTDGGGVDYEGVLDLPDGCAVVEGPNNLTFTNNSGPTEIHTHCVGYFYDVP